MRRKKNKPSTALALRVAIVNEAIYTGPDFTAIFLRAWARSLEHPESAERIAIEAVRKENNNVH